MKLVSVPPSPLRPRAFTLVELLISLAIVAVLVAIVLPSVRGAVGYARTFKCQTSLRSVAFDFALFADDTLHPSRGDDEFADTGVGSRMFRLETFVESQYGLDEFWSYGNTTLARLPDAAGRDPMRCPEVRGDITLRRGVPCDQGGVNPSQNISFGFNIRLDRAEGVAGKLPLSARLLSGNAAASPSSIPLTWDVDGSLAAQRNKSPLFSGPSLGTSAFENDAYWFPAMRHGNQINAAFIDGHVANSSMPLQESWSWSFQPGR